MIIRLKSSLKPLIGSVGPREGRYGYDHTEAKGSCYGRKVLVILSTVTVTVWVTVL